MFQLFIILHNGYTADIIEHKGPFIVYKVNNMVVDDLVMLRSRVHGTYLVSKPESTDLCHT